MLARIKYSLHNYVRLQGFCRPPTLPEAFTYDSAAAYEDVCSLSVCETPQAAYRCEPGRKQAAGIRNVSVSAMGSPYQAYVPPTAGDGQTVRRSR
ncbi:hypothetical protein VPNG_07573 [Cytospora leucostoma]|uniref:Uncharacterized protein n=1 Tax=Cytospora leucostoma TaxID=1230097 RepID=A0A423WDH0_9PEZI|nr:hypothetical protein VPNG_07573 [Cytospora leucostoma]